MTQNQKQNHRVPYPNLVRSGVSESTAPELILTGLHLRMYLVMCDGSGAFHWMGWELGWLGVSVIITWTGPVVPENENV